MDRPRSSRARIPSAKTLGLTRPRAQDDLNDLGWNTEEHVGLLRTLGAAGNPDLALNNLVRLVEALREREDNDQLAAVSSLPSVGKDVPFSDATRHHP